MAKNQNQVTTLDDDAQGVSNAAAPEAVSPEASVLIKHNESLSGERKILTIHTAAGEEGNHAVFVGLNGVGYQVPRGKSWNVPAELVSNLENAVEVRYERNSAGKIEPREVPRFAFSVKDAPSLKAAAKSA